MWVWSLDWEDTLEEGMTTHSSILAWRIPWTEEPGGLQSIRSQRVGHIQNNLACTHTNQCEIMQSLWGFCFHLSNIFSWLPWANHKGFIFIFTLPGKGQFSFQSLRKAMPKNAQTTTQLLSSHTLAEYAQNSPRQASTVCELRTSKCSSWI